MSNARYNLFPSKPAFNATATASTVLGTGWQIVDYAQLVSQQGSSYNASNYRFTAPVDGWYQFNATWSANNNDDVDGTITFVLNGYASSNKGTVSMPNTGGNYDGHALSSCFHLSENDYVEVGRYSTVSTTTRSYQWTGNFSGFLVS